MGLELLLLTVLAPGEQRKKLLFTIVPAGLLILLLAFLFPNSPPGHYILLQLSTVVDEMFGTSYAIRYGVDSTSLANSASYRDALLDIFTVDWLNPLLGLGRKRWARAPDTISPGIFREGPRSTPLTISMWPIISATGIRDWWPTDC